MEFQYWLNESSLNDLHQSAVAAFPGTTRRQHATHPIEISNLRWTPFLGMRTLMVKAVARNEDREYTPFIVFKNVQYHNVRDIYGLVEITASDGAQYLFERLSVNENDVLVRCNCKDFYWRFNYYDHVDRSLYGRKRSPYEAIFNPGSANPQEMPGMCKHLMKFAEVLGHSGVIS